MRAIALICFASVLSAAAARAQHDHPPSPYAGQELTDIPSLSAQDLADLRNGAGMGFARAAELNHFPGPKHVLELAESLDLSADQRRRVQAIFESMRETALTLGDRIIEGERALNARFRHGHIDSNTVRIMTSEIAGLYGELRSAHLQAHLATTALLSGEQVAAYERLRGYVAPDGRPGR